MTRRTKTRVMVGLAVLAGIGIFAAANAHLVWTSVRSQPDCVPHLDAPGQDGQFRAAKSSC
jgi:hypothetical protein